MRKQIIGVEERNWKDKTTGEPMSMKVLHMTAHNLNTIGLQTSTLNINSERISRLEKVPEPGDIWDIDYNERGYLDSMNFVESLTQKAGK